MAVLYGALNAALDSTAGERERGSLEPLLMNPPAPLAGRAGQVGGGDGGGAADRAAELLQLHPPQWLLRGDALAALFQFGVHEALWFLADRAFAAALAALLMAVAIRCRSVKEAQASTAVLGLGVSLLPLFGLLNPGAGRWHFWVPALAQNTLMTRVLKGEALGAEALGVAAGVPDGAGRHRLRGARAAARGGTMSASAAPEVRCAAAPSTALAVAELDAIYRARQQVFVIEQGCAYLGRRVSTRSAGIWRPAAGGRVGAGRPARLPRIVAPVNHPARRRSGA